MYHIMTKTLAVVGEMGYGIVDWATEQILTVIESSRFGHIYLHAGYSTPFHRPCLCNFT